MSIHYKNDKIMLLYVVVLISSYVVLLNACAVNKFSYHNIYEKDYMKKSSRAGNVFIWHDEKAIKKQRNDGVYTVNFSDNGSSGYYCKQKEASLIDRAIKGATYIRKMMNHKNCYRYIDFVFESENSEVRQIRGTEIPSCLIQIRMPIDSLSKAKIIRHSNNYSGTDIQR